MLLAALVLVLGATGTAPPSCPASGKADPDSDFVSMLAVKSANDDFCCSTGSTTCCVNCYFPHSRGLYTVWGPLTLCNKPTL
jgi:hypothetical protein